jgi:predicted O-methyltransferase YrrM
MDINAFLSDVPQLHTWDNGATWNTGGFFAEDLEILYSFAKANLPRGARILETGAGNSTICFLLLSPERLVSIAPDAALFDRIRSYCARAEIPTSALDSRVDGSEWVLPNLAREMRDQAPRFDFALIDGCHNWPMVFLDFFYTNYMLKTGGLLMIDDIQLHSIRELARMLMEQPEFQLEKKIGKSLIFRRTGDVRILGECDSIPYIARKTNEYALTGDPFSL